MWKVTGTGNQTGTEYVYTVDAPADAREIDVVISAAREHGMNIQRGTVNETLRPDMIATQHNA